MVPLAAWCPKSASHKIKALRLEQSSKGEKSRPRHVSGFEDDTGGGDSLKRPQRKHLLTSCTASRWLRGAGLGLPLQLRHHHTQPTALRKCVLLKVQVYVYVCECARVCVRVSCTRARVCV